MATLEKSEVLSDADAVSGLFGVWTFHHSLLDVLPWRQADLRTVAAQIPPNWLNAYDADGARLSEGITPLQALDRLDTVTGVVRLLHIELVPGYRQTMEHVIRTAASIATPGESVRRHTGVVYVANQGSGARLHVDNHPNFFVHLAGRKRFTIAGCSNTRKHQELVSSYASGRRLEALEPDVFRTFDLGPGDALYLPPFTIHGVETPEGRSVSVACSWSTAGSEHAVRMLWANRQLRRVGLRAGSSFRRRRRDPFKLAFARVVSRIR